MSVLTRLSADFYDRAAFAGFQAQSGFSIANAKALMWLSQLSYETDDPDKVKMLLAAWNLALVPGGIVSSPATSSLPMPRTEAIVAQGNGAAFVAFAGTDPLVTADWIADFNFRPHMGTTEGFALALAAAMPAIRALIAPLGVPIFVTGHSLGGALAVLAAVELAKAGAAVVAVYTYGMPRPGNAHFKSEYDGRLGATTYRLVNGDDIVPTVGPSFLGFKHVGRPLHCARGTHFSASALAADTNSDDPPFAGSGTAHGLFDRLLAPFGGGAAAAVLNNPGQLAGRPDFVKVLIQLLPEPIKDHVPENYIAALT